MKIGTRSKPVATVFNSITYFESPVLIGLALD